MTTSDALTALQGPFCLKTYNGDRVAIGYTGLTLSRAVWARICPGYGWRNLIEVREVLSRHGVHRDSEIAFEVYDDA